jgi:hypothetical protein
MTELAQTQPDFALRAVPRLRALLTIASIAIVGLTLAVILLAANGNGGSTTGKPTAGSRAAQTADTGARLDHRGLRGPSLAYRGPK